MGLLRGGGSSGTPETCLHCGRFIKPDSVDDYCETCLEELPSGDKYCCGLIYEDGEDTCASCGEPL